MTTPQTLSYPLRIVSGRLAAVPQGSTADLSSSLTLLLNSRPGERRTDPGYGVPDPVFGGVDASHVAAKIRVYESRADQPTVDQLSRTFVAGASTEETLVSADVPAGSGA